MRPRSLGLVGLYVGAQLVALALAYPFRSQGLAAGANPNSPTTPVLLFALIVAVPVVILLLARLRGVFTMLRLVILLGIATGLVVGLGATFAILLPFWTYLPPAMAGLAVAPASILAPAAAVVMFAFLLIEPQWYVVDIVGFLAAGALIALLALQIAVLPSLLLLAGLAVYDAVAVYGTKHMVSLAEVVTEMKLPILMVVPGSASYDYTRPGGLAEQRARPVEEREAVFMGLGDVVFPGLLVVAAFLWLPVAPAHAGLGANLLTALGTMGGSLVGYAILMRFVARGNPQAGLPLLNGGAIAGYLATFFLLYRSLGFGLGLG